MTAHNEIYQDPAALGWNPRPDLSARGYVAWEKLDGAIRYFRATDRIVIVLPTDAQGEPPFEGLESIPEPYEPAQLKEAEDLPPSVRYAMNHPD